MHPERTDISTLLGVLALGLLLAGCKLDHPQNAVATADSTAVGRALAMSVVPRLAPGTTADLRIDASRIGGSFASTFERELAPAVTFARGSGRQTSFVAVTVDSLSLALDSATAVVRDTSPSSANTLRVRLIPRAEGGWRVVSQEVLRHRDIVPGTPQPTKPARAEPKRK
jgi:hypothetical protein